jgi:uncharacterized protein
MVTRDAEKKIRLYAKQFRALAIVGPRQSGKTTLVKKVFPKKSYVSLEDPDERTMALEDPRFFLSRFKKGAIIDEAQRAPDLFSYLQQIIDNAAKDCMFVLTGSNNFLLQQSISQTLAGRIGYIDLLPLTLKEIKQFPFNFTEPDEWMLNGTYPEIYDKQRKPSIWYPSYIRTYVERDIRMIKNIENSNLFTKFLKICAGRIGQLINLSAISIECGIDIKTVQSWLSILESSFIIYLLKPHHNNFNKRLVKSPKLYFYDTGLACSLIGIKSTKELLLTHFRGALFENTVIMELLKQQLNKENPGQIYFWRDNKGIEIDLLIDNGTSLQPIEIKSAKTYNNDFLKNIRYWNDLAANKTGTLIYCGDKSYSLPDKMKVLSWMDL